MRMTRCLALLAAPALLALRLPAQECGTSGRSAPTLRAGETARGELDPADYTLVGDRFDGSDPCTGRAYEPYFYQARAGERITLILDSEGADMTLTVANGYRSQGGVELGRVSTRGGQATVTVTSSTAARLLIQAESNVSRGRPGAYGRYRLTVRAAGRVPSPELAEAPPARLGTTEAPEVITRQLALVAERLRGQGYRPAGSAVIAGALENGTQEDRPLSLTAREFLVVGVCDGDCSDMDLRLFDPSGSAVAEDVAGDDFPVLRFSAASAGEYRLRVMMPACSADPCAYGVSLFTR